MSPLRLSAGRRLAPVNRPAIVGVRKLELDTPKNFSLISTSSLPMRPEEAVRSLAASLSAPPIMEIPVEKIGERESRSFPVVLRAMDVEEIDFESLMVSSPVGGRVEEPPERDPWDRLPAAFSPLEGGESTDPTSGVHFIDLLKPFLVPIPEEEGEVRSTSELSLRPYQAEAVHALRSRSSLMLADDTGMGKTIAAIVAMSALFREGELGRVLVLCPSGLFRHWSLHLQEWAPALTVSVLASEAQMRRLAWTSPAHVLIADYKTIDEDVLAGRCPLEELSMDLVLLDSVFTTRRIGSEVWDSLAKMEVARKWVLAGGLPQEADDWMRIFGYLNPEAARLEAGATVPNLEKLFRPQILRRSKDIVQDQMPRRFRQEIWLDLDQGQFVEYENALAEERQRLRSLGGSVSRTHIIAAVDRLKIISAFSGSTLDGPKVRMLVDILEDIRASDSKMVVFSHYARQSLDKLHTVLEPYGALRLHASDVISDRNQVVSRFRRDPDIHVLLADIEARTDGEPLVEASYVLHYGHNWNPAVRLRAEQRIHPMIGPGVPIQILEFWMAGTFEVELHRALSERGMLPNDLARDTRPAELEERISIEGWLEEILKTHDTAALPRRRVERTMPTGLPGTTALLTDLSSLDLNSLLEGAAELMRALGFQEVEDLYKEDEGQGGLIAAREGAEGGKDRVRVRLLKSESNVGISEGRDLLQEVDDSEEFIGGYLITTSDFTSALKKLAEGSDGQLALVSGSELSRHLRILGWF